MWRLGAGLAVAISLAACGADPTTVAALSTVGPTTVTPVTMTAAEDGDSAFRVDVSRWPAGSDQTDVAWHAATVALMSAGEDPRGRVLSLSAAERLDGSSAGPLLAAGSWAALDSVGLSDAMSLVGTLLPNGAVGPVSGIPTSLRAAAQAGIGTVLIPAHPRLVVDDHDRRVLPEGLAESVGVTVRRVSSLAEASAVMRGEPVPAAAPAPELDPDLVDLVTIASEQIIEQMTAVLTSVPPAQRPEMVRSIRAARAALTAGRPFVAYATITLAQQEYQMDEAARATTSGRIGVVRRDLVRDVRQRRQLTVRSLRLYGSTPLRAVEQYSALADALTWATGTLGLLEPLDQAAAAARTRDQLAAVARQIARAAYRVSTYLPLQVEAAARIGSVPISDPAGIESLLGSYAHLLARAADSNWGSLPLRLRSQRDVWRQLGTARTGQEATVVSLAAALSYYVASGDASVAAESFAAQVASATQINNQISDTLTQLEFDPSYVVWGDEWGRTWAAGGRTDPVVRTTGVTYQWYATVQGQMLRGLASVSGRQ